jgi:hypothetical protein
MHLLAWDLPRHVGVSHKEAKEMTGTCDMILAYDSITLQGEMKEEEKQEKKHYTRQEFRFISSPCKAALDNLVGKRHAHHCGTPWQSVPNRRRVEEGKTA